MGWRYECEINPGFYSVKADPSGTSLKAIAEGIKNGDDDYVVDADELKDYAVYIDADGNISNAYVDTGLFTGDGTLGGFSGGAVQ